MPSPLSLQLQPRLQLRAGTAILLVTLNVALPAALLALAVHSKTPDPKKQRLQTPCPSTNPPRKKSAILPFPLKQFQVKQFQVKQLQLKQFQVKQLQLKQFQLRIILLIFHKTKRPHADATAGAAETKVKRTGKARKSGKRKNPLRPGSLKA